MPKGIRHITLLYHQVNAARCLSFLSFFPLTSPTQCVIVATRPLLLSVLKERLEKLGHGEEDWENFLAPTKSLISTGIKSAAKTLQILTHEDSLLGKSIVIPTILWNDGEIDINVNVVEVFLPFDLEFTYAAAIHLTMANTLFPHEADCQTYSEQARSILDEMVYKGNRLAAARKTELAHLEKLFGELAARIERRGLQTLTLSAPEHNENGNNENEDENENENGTDEGTNEQHEETTPTVPTTIALSATGDTDPSPSDLPPIPSNLEFLDNIGISSYEFLSLVDQIGNPEIPGVWDPGQARSNGL